VWEADAFEGNDEDIHSANERMLTERIGAVAGKLHTGRSRNDQVVTDMRMYTSAEIDEVGALVRAVCKVLSDRAEAELDVLMPGYTHLQHAQVVRWSHFLMSHVAALRRDHERLVDCQRRVRQLPLGCGAVAGHPFNLDRRQLADDLGFPRDRIATNSIDTVGDRDFVIETLFVCSLLGVHLSRFAEDMIIFASKEFSYVDCGDAYSTGSSLMPQKRNPDGLELVRGKSGGLLGHLVGVLATVKGLPSSYSKDLQGDKEPLFAALDTVKAVLAITCGIASTMTVNKARTEAGLTPELLTTDLAEYLVRKGMPFRETHHVAGAAIALAEKKGGTLFDLTLEDLRSLEGGELFTEDVMNLWNYAASADSRDTFGGTGKNSVLEQVAEARKWIAEGDAIAK
jgi:argininosuccinate lyase